MLELDEIDNNIGCTEKAIEFSCTERKARLDKLISEFLNGEISREKIKKLIIDGKCTVDDVLCKEPAYKVNRDQKIIFTIIKECTELSPEEGELDIVYEDSDLLVINKSPYLTVHPAPSCMSNTLVQRVLNICPELKLQEGLRPGIVHRLDKDTSGLIIIAKNEITRLKLSNEFAERNVHKRYFAIVNGIIPEEGDCFFNIGRHPTNKIKMAVTKNGRDAHSSWKRVLYDNEKNFSLVDVQLHTGRTHQIRVHLSELGFPLLGDSLYSGPQIASRAPRQMLHAHELIFIHPTNGKEMKFNQEVPNDFLECLSTGNYNEKIVVTGCAGSGKSKFTRNMGDLGVKTWSADEAVNRTYEYGATGWQVLNHYYQGRFTKEGQAVDKIALAKAMSEERNLKNEIERYIHPLVMHDLNNFFEEEKSEILVAEVPLWFETKHKPKIENLSVIGIECEDSLRHARLQKTRNWNTEKIEMTDKWHIEQNEKMLMCDYVIKNNSSEEDLFTETEKFKNFLEHKISTAKQNKIKYFKEILAKA